MKTAFKYGGIQIVNQVSVGLVGSGVTTWIAGAGGLLDSSAGGRVPMIQYPKGRAENLDNLVDSLRKEQEAQTRELQARHAKAMRYMQTGQF